MGVTGLRSFIRDNPDIILKGHRISNTKVVVDAPNLVNRLFHQCTTKCRHDLYGGDMTKFALCIREFLDLFRTASVSLIFVFDGAAEPGHKSKTPEKLRRAKERFRCSMKISKQGYGSSQLPISATCVFRSIIVDAKCQVVQCIYEADSQAARIARDLKCPLLSSDSDFYLMDLPGGLFSYDDLNPEPQLARNGSHFIECDLYRIDKLVNLFPELDKACLPLLGILIGNDFVDDRKFNNFTENLPHKLLASQCDMKTRNLERTLGHKSFQILKVFYFLCGKSLDQAIQCICSAFGSDERNGLKKFIRNNLELYQIPDIDNFDDEFFNLYRDGYCRCFGDNYDSREQLEQDFAESMTKVKRWIKRATEGDVLTQLILQIITRSIIPIRSVADDQSLPSCRQSLYRFIEVAMSLVRSDLSDEEPCIVYDRLDQGYNSIEIYPLSELPLYGPLIHTIFELPHLDINIRRQILLNSFRSCEEDYSERVERAQKWFSELEAEEHAKIQLLIEFIDKEFTGASLWNHFKKAVNMSFLFYLGLRNKRQNLNQDLGKSKFLNILIESINRLRLDWPQDARRGEMYNIRLVHQINQLQSSIVSFNLLNSLLGCTLSRIRLENWFNSPLIYNLTLKLRARQLYFETNFPPCIYVIPNRHF